MEITSLTATFQAWSSHRTILANEKKVEMNLLRDSQNSYFPDTATALVSALSLHPSSCLEGRCNGHCVHMSGWPRVLIDSGPDTTELLINDQISAIIYLQTVSNTLFV